MFELSLSLFAILFIQLFNPINATPSLTPSASTPKSFSVERISALGISSSVILCKELLLPRRRQEKDKRKGDF